MLFALVERLLIVDLFEVCVKRANDFKSDPTRQTKDDIKPYLCYNTTGVKQQHLNKHILQ